MSLIYTKTNKIKFTSISEKYNVNRSVKGKLSELHSMLITYVSSNFKNTKKYKQQVVNMLNLITYAVYADEPIGVNWSSSNPFEEIPNIDEEDVKNVLGDIYLTVDSIDWDVTPSTDADVLANTNKATPDNKPHIESKPIQKMRDDSLSVEPSVPPSSLTPKQDLYIQPPLIPQFDYDQVWMSGVRGADRLVIYKTLPEIPTKQNEISCTTDVTKMRYSELMNLFPNHVIHTRSSTMYYPTDGLEMVDDLGLILPIEGYSRDQLIQNMIEYPHFYKLIRLVDETFISFYSNIEIDGVLYDTLDVWDSLPESKVIPKHADFLKEYVVRRYLLERDRGVSHKYPLFGSLDPFLTLFMPREKYIERGYSDVEDIARKCVISRIKYKQSRNPVIRRLSQDA